MKEKITLDYYQKLCTSSRYFLRKFKNNIFILSNPAFFIIREHSSEISDIFIFDKIKLYFLIIYKVISLPLKLSINFLSSLLIKKKRSKILKNSGIIICHKGNNKNSYINPMKLFYGLDFIEGYKSIFYKDSVYDKEIWTKSLKQKSEIDKLFVPPYLSFKDEIKYSYKVIFSCIDLLKLLIKTKKETEKIIILNALLHSLGLSNLIGLRIYKYIKDNIEKRQPKFLLTTYEGYPWERLICFLGSELKIPTIGYMHAPISKYQFSTFNSISSDYDPNIILLKSKRDLKISQKGTISKFSEIKNIGQHNKNVEKIFSHFKNKQSKFSNIRILLLPEEYTTEVNIFLKAVEKSLANTVFNYVLRLHPNTSINKRIFLSKKIDKINKKNKSIRITLSKDTLINDIKNCPIAVYRGSSAIIFAMQNSDILPIYLLSNSIMTNPLHYLSSKIFSIKKFSEIPKEINKIPKKFFENNLDNHFDAFDEEFFIEELNEFINNYKHKIN